MDFGAILKMISGQSGDKGAGYGIQAAQQGAAQSQQVSPGNTNSLQSLQQSVGGMMNRQDNGFYSHMTVGKARKGRKVNIVGRGD